VATGYTGIQTLVFTGPGDSPDGTAPTYPSSVTFTAGAATVSVTLTDAQVTTLVATRGSITGSSPSVTVDAAAAVSLTVVAPATAASAAPLNVQVTAQDTFANTATGYAGTIGFTSGDSHAVLPAPSTLTNGVGTFPVTFKTAGTQTITAADTVTSSITGVSGQVTVNPGAASQFVVAAASSATTTAPVTVIVTARDQSGNVATRYTGTVKITSSDPAATLPAAAALHDGVGTSALSFGTAGSQTVRASDSVQPSVTGVSGTITVTSPPSAPIGLTATVTISGITLALGPAEQRRWSADHRLPDLPGHEPRR
jgi:hypothetical protein